MWMLSCEYLLPTELDFTVAGPSMPFANRCPAIHDPAKW